MTIHYGKAAVSIYRTDGVSTLGFARESDVLFRRLYDDECVAELELDRDPRPSLRPARAHLIELTGTVRRDRPRAEEGLSPCDDASSVTKSPLVATGV